MPELHVTVVAASDLMSVDGSAGRGEDHVLALLWIDPARKLSTRRHGGGARFPVWNDELVFHQDVLARNSTITIQVVSQGLRSPRRSLLGTAELPVAEVARMKAMREKPDDPDAVLLQLRTPTNHVRGSITLSISLVSGWSHGRSTSRLMTFMPEQSAPVMGYPVCILRHELQASSGDMEAYALTHLSSGQYWGSHGVRHVAVVVGIGGVVAGFVIRDILAIFFQ